MKEAETLGVEPPDPSQKPVICPRGGRGFGGEETRRKTLWTRSLGAQGQHHRSFIRAAVRRSVSEPGEHHPMVGAWLSRPDAHRPITTVARTQELADSPGPVSFNPAQEEGEEGRKEN